MKAFVKSIILLWVIVIPVFGFAAIGNTLSMGGRHGFSKELRKYVTELLPTLKDIPEERKEKLNDVAKSIANTLKEGRTANLTFICTHNSRRSQLAQVWAATAANWYNIDGVRAFSSGTEATAFNYRAVAALERAGFQIAQVEGENPHYSVSFSSDVSPLTCFSKKIDDPANPHTGFIAIMTCSHADAACPVVAGADARFPLPYEDPKVADGTAQEAAVYDARCLEIAREMFYLLREVKNLG